MSYYFRVEANLFLLLLLLLGKEDWARKDRRNLALEFFGSRSRLGVTTEPSAMKERESGGNMTFRKWLAGHLEGNQAETAAASFFFFFSEIKKRETLYRY